MKHNGIGRSFDVTKNISRRYAKYLYADCVEFGVATGVALRSATHIVRNTINFDRDPF